MKPSKPLSFDEVVYFGCAAYSMIHPNRAAELNHLFLSYGNGYEWQNGELVECVGETTYKNGRRKSLTAAINSVFKRRRRDDEFRKRYEKNRKAKEKRLRTHGKSCPKITKCNCGSNPHDKFCCTFFPGTEICNCGAQVHIDKDKPLDTKLDKLIEDTIAQMKAAREKDPVAFEEKRKKQEAEFKESRRQWRAAQKWEYAIPTDIDKRVEWQKPAPGAHDGYDHWYPPSEKYSAIFDYDPETIKDEWLGGIIEVCQLVIANPPKPRRIPGQDNAAAQREAENTVRLCKKALERAEGLVRHRVYSGPAFAKI